MPRKSSQSRRLRAAHSVGRARLSYSPTETVRVPFRRWVLFQQATSYNGLFNLVPNNLGDVIAAMRTSFAHWRMNHLKVKIFSGSHPVEVYNAGYKPGGDLALAVGFTAIDYTKFLSTPSWNSATQMPVYNMGPASGPVSIEVGQRDLRKITVPWLETTSTGSESEAFQSAGVVYHGTYVSTSVESGFIIHVLFEGEVEFRDRIDNAVSLFAQPSSGPAAEADERYSPPRLMRQEEDVSSYVSVSRGPIPPPQVLRGASQSLRCS